MVNEEITNTYKYDILCKNCSCIIWFNIPIGESVDDFFERNKLCPKCGCEHGMVREG